ncbi:hypothetical protein D3C81_1558210 [compost metagenome]
MTKAVSVAMTVPQPFWPGCPCCSIQYSAAGTTMPPRAAEIDSAAMRGLFSSPRTSSRLSSRATRKKNSVIRASLIQPLSERVYSSGPSRKPP